MIVTMTIIIIFIITTIITKNITNANGHDYKRKL
jgi:preprotein translocase subunit SecG